MKSQKFSLFLGILTKPLLNMNKIDKTLANFFTQLFVDQHVYLTEIVNLVNAEFRNGNIPYQYTYDEFCCDFLKEIELNPDKFEVFRSTNELQFSKLFAYLSFSICEDLMRKKIISLGFDWNKFKGGVSPNKGFHFGNKHTPRKN